MALKSQLRKIITGLTVPREYCCLELEKLKETLSVNLTTKDSKVSLDVTKSHLFLGYKPLIIGIPFEINSEEFKSIKNQDHICLSFGEGNFTQNFTCRGFPASRESVARLFLRKAGERILGADTILYFVGEHGEHSFLNPLHQFFNRQRVKIQRTPTENVNLPGNLLDQVRIAYAVPRVISMITVGNGSSINMFPTDLHGSLRKSGYVSSLRIGGKANSQVESLKKIVISTVDSSSYKETYTLGKNHMADLQDEKLFSLHRERSKVFDLPLPSCVLSYRELKQVDSFDLGIHRIHLYEVVHENIVRQDVPTLAHIHQYYAQWRIDREKFTQLFFY